MDKLDDTLRSCIERAPQSEYDVIIRVCDRRDMTPVALACQARGMDVHRRLRLLPGLSVTGTGVALADLVADNTHIARVELDRPVGIA